MMFQSCPNDPQCMHSALVHDESGDAEDPRPTPIDLGHGHTIRFVAWAPDRALNPQYEGIPDDPRAVAIAEHAKPAGGECEGGYITFDSAPAPVLKDGRPTWHVESWDPLTLSPSLLCTACGDHGFIRDGRWVPA